MENFSGELRAVKLDLKACVVNINAEDGSGLIGVEYKGHKDLEPDAAFADGILSFTQKPVNGVRLGVMAVNQPRITVTVGKDTFLNYVDIKVNAGNISIKGISADWLSAVVSAGNINVSDSNFLKADIKAKAGNTNISYTNLNQVSVDVKTGNAKLNAAEELDQYDIDCKVRNGNIRIGNEKSSGGYSSKGQDGSSIKVKANTGSIEID